MEGTVSEIRLFAGPFEPKNWAYCAGQIMPISSNQALYSLLGTYYGGNGVTTFNLPDLRSKTVIGAGQGAGLSAYSIGQFVGTEGVTLTMNQIPAHTHQTTLTPNPASGTGNATLNGLPIGGDSMNGQNAFISEDDTQQTQHFVSAGTPLAMSGKSVDVSNLTMANPTVVVGNSGGNVPHSNIMPTIALNYIICLRGLYPSRN